MAKYQKGDNVKLRDDGFYSTKGCYGKHLGVPATVKQVHTSNWNYSASYDIETVDGVKYQYVPQDGLAFVVEGTEFTELDKIEETIKILEERVETLKRQVSMIRSLGLTSLNEKQKEAVRLSSVFGVTIENEEQLNNFVEKLSQ